MKEDITTYTYEIQSTIKNVSKNYTPINWKMEKKKWIKFLEEIL
jgi:hypothetical protein